MYLRIQMTSQDAWDNAHKVLVSLGYTDYSDSKSNCFKRNAKTHLDWLCYQTVHVGTLISHTSRCSTPTTSATITLCNYNYSEWFVANISGDCTKDICVDARKRISFYPTLLGEYFDKQIVDLIIEYC